MGKPADHSGTEKVKQPPSRKAGEAAQEEICAQGQGGEEEGTREGATHPLFRHSARHSHLTPGDSCEPACFPEEECEDRGACPG